MPVGFFYKNIKIYLYILIIWIVITPFFLFSIILFNQSPDAGLIVLGMQTDKTEIAELVYGFKAMFAVLTILYTFFYLLAVKSLSYKRIFFKTAIGISVFAIIILAGEYIIQPKKHTNWALRYFENYYPMSFLYGLYKTYAYAKKNNIEQSEKFFFQAHSKNTIPERQVYVLVIGESSRYDRWQVNGYPKATSPRLSQRENLIVFSNVISGGSLTEVVVPQIITRANPDNMELQYKEKSILSAFKEAGFKTAWLSNQLGRGIFTSGTIPAHAKTADFFRFSSYEGFNNEKYYYDERLLPLLDSVIRSDNRNYFVVLHLFGSHWDYSKRYPKKFDYFKPSGYTQSISPPTNENKEAFLNTYDNTIRYSDFVIDSIIGIIKKYHTVSTVMYISDHGEALFDNPNGSKFHNDANRFTLHVPFFIWTSDGYPKKIPGKKEILSSHIKNKIGTENAFYTLLDLANISFPGFDSTKSIAHPSFKDNKQKYYIPNKEKAYYYNELK